ncbi:MAG: tetratricopeptide (TPR) repeat protein [Bradymonadia bacterium]|jgi:tetratricopeptide (TPR) repeat protein
MREAVRTLRRAVNRAERDLIPTQQELDARLQLAAALMRDGEREAAVQHLRYVTLARPSFFSYRLAYAIALRGSVSGSERALEQLDICISIEEHIGPCWELRGDILRELARPEDAVRSYEHALLLLDEDAEVLRSLTSAALEAGQAERAAEAARELVDSLGAEIEFSTLLLAARAFEADGQHEDAETFYRRAADAHRSSARGLRLLLDYLRRSEQTEEASEIERRLSGLMNERR